MVDGAHSFAHLDFKIPDLKCDYFGASLHKWLSAPLGSGMLYVKKDKIDDVWPLLAAGDFAGAATDTPRGIHQHTGCVSERDATPCQLRDVQMVHADGNTGDALERRARPKQLLKWRVLTLQKRCGKYLYKNVLFSSKVVQSTQSL